MIKAAKPKFTVEKSLRGEIEEKQYQVQPISLAIELASPQTERSFAPLLAAESNSEVAYLRQHTGYRQVK